MIPRYTRPEMATLWSRENRFRILLEIELLACEAMAELGQVPMADARTCRERADFDIDRVDELELTLKHDVIAFLTAVTETVGPAARWLHKGMTSSDVLDTASAVQFRDAGRLILQELDAALEVVERRAKETKDLVCIGRSHGIHAEPTTFGLKLAGWYDDLRRCRARVAQATDELAVGAISGAVGTYAFVDPQVEAFVCERLGLKVAAVTTQIVSRDRHADFFCALALTAAVIERCAVEIRHLQRTEVLEAEEPFTKGQKGSSAMPHKRNPILSENLTGLARLVRSYAGPALENVALWHERDISHSSVERVIGPDATTALHFMLHRFTRMMDGLVVYPENMKRNLNMLGGIHFSQRVMLTLVESGMTREEAYALVQQHAMRVWRGEGDLRSLIEADPEVESRLDAATLAEMFDLDAYIGRRDFIFQRVFSGE
jgi:adenylosuccinate lyase